MIALSFSRWADSMCPFRFHALHIARSHKEPVTEIMQIGGEFAEVVKGYRMHCYRAGVTSDLEYKQGFKYGQTKELFDRFLTSEFAVLPITSTLVSIEHKLAFDSELNPIVPEAGQREDDAWFSKDAAFRCIADFAYVEGDTLYVIDDKTGWGDPDPDQLLFMAHLLPRAITVEVKRVCGIFNEVAKGRKTIAVDAALEDLEDIGPKIIERIREVNSWTEFPPHACAKCPTCTVPGCAIRESANAALVSAPGTPSLTIPESIRTRDQAEAALLFVQFADGIVRRVKDLLKEYVHDNGDVYAGGKRAGLMEVEEWTPRDLSRFCASLVQMGAPPELVWQNLSLTKTGIEKILKKAKEVNPVMVMSMLDRRPAKAFRITNDRTL
jgi:hypothetical protein